MLMVNEKTADFYGRAKQFLVQVTSSRQYNGYGEMAHLKGINNAVMELFWRDYISTQAADKALANGLGFADRAKRKLILER